MNVQLESEFSIRFKIISGEYQQCQNQTLLKNIILALNLFPLQEGILTP